MLDSTLMTRASPIAPQPPVRVRAVCPRAVMILALAGVFGSGVSTFILRDQTVLRWLAPIGVITVVTMLGILMLRRCMRATTRRMRADIDRLERMADSDALTAIPNRRAFARELDREFQRARRYSHSLSIVFIDLDNFKAINDTHGHAAGDVALQTLASVLTSAVRGSDLAARIGGDEFALLLVQTNADMARRVVDRIQEILTHWPFVLSQDPPVSAYIHASAGIGTLDAQTTDPSALLHAADLALYAAKGERRAAGGGSGSA